MTGYEEVLAAGVKVGASKADDQQLMAMFCQSSIQILCGAVSPKLVFEGAQAAGMTTSDLNKLALTDSLAVADLMWAGE